MNPKLTPRTVFFRFAFVAKNMMFATGMLPQGQMRSRFETLVQGFGVAVEEFVVLRFADLFEGACV